MVKKEYIKMLECVPPYNLFRLMESKERTKLNTVGHIAYALIGGLLLFGSLGIGVVKLTERYFEYYERDGRVRIEVLSNQLFGENGYADANKDKKIGLDELADAYIRMGLDGQVMQTGKFPSAQNI